jgi:hypothetical protein
MVKKYYSAVELKLQEFVSSELKGRKWQPLLFCPSVTGNKNSGTH